MKATKRFHTVAIGGGPAGSPVAKPVTSIRKNMLPRLMPLLDKLLLRKQAIIETINDQLKNISQIARKRYRSAVNFMVNLLAGLIAYTWQPRKQSHEPGERGRTTLTCPHLILNSRWLGYQ